MACPLLSCKCIAWIWKCLEEWWFMQIKNVFDQLTEQDKIIIMFPFMINLSSQVKWAIWWVQLLDVQPLVIIRHCKSPNVFRYTWYWCMPWAFIRKSKYYGIHKIIASPETKPIFFFPRWIEKTPLGIYRIVWDH